MQYALEIPEYNIQAHVDIESDIQKQRNGLFTFIIRLNNSKVVDYSILSYATARDYLELKRVIITQFIISRDTPAGNTKDEVGPDNNKHNA